MRGAAASGPGRGERARVRPCACARVRVCARARARARACFCVGVGAHVCPHACVRAPVHVPVCACARVCVRGCSCLCPHGGICSRACVRVWVRVPGCVSVSVSAWVPRCVPGCVGVLTPVTLLVQASVFVCVCVCRGVYAGRVRVGAHACARGSVRVHTRVCGCPGWGRPFCLCCWARDGQGPGGWCEAGPWERRGPWHWSPAPPGYREQWYFGQCLEEPRQAVGICTVSGKALLTLHDPGAEGGGGWRGERPLSSPAPPQAAAVTGPPGRV